MVFCRRAHGAAAGEAEIDLGRVWMAVVGADLTRLPAGDGDIAVRHSAEDVLDVALGIPLLFAFEAENVHESYLHRTR